MESGCDNMDFYELRKSAQQVDSLVELDYHPVVPMAIRVRPSHPRYLQALIETVEHFRPMGVLVFYVREEEFTLQLGRTRAQVRSSWRMWLDKITKGVRT